LECGGKRSATPLWILCSSFELLYGRQTKTPSALRSAGVLQSAHSKNSEAANACARRLPVNCWDWPEADCRAFLKEEEHYAVRRLNLNPN